MPEIVIKVEQVSKFFGEDQVLKEVSVQLEKGKAYGIIGNNGSGKTVLFKCICGFMKPDKGIIEVEQKRIGVDIDFPENICIII